MRAIILSLWAILILGACLNDDFFDRDARLTNSSNSECVETHPLIVNSQDNDRRQVGDIELRIEGDELLVKYVLQEGWHLKELFIYAGSEYEMQQMNALEAPITSFPIQEKVDYSNVYEKRIPLIGLDPCFVVSAHAFVVLLEDGVQTDMGITWNAGNSGLEEEEIYSYHDYCKECCLINSKDTPIYAGQYKLAGKLEVTNDDTFLYVTYRWDDSWMSPLTHLYVGSIEAMPTTGSGTPIPGQFPYSQAHLIDERAYTYQIPLVELGNCFVIAAHAEVMNGNKKETAWAFGTPFMSKRWGWYLDYCLQFCD